MARLCIHAVRAGLSSIGFTGRAADSPALPEADLALVAAARVRKRRQLKLAIPVVA